VKRAAAFRSVAHFVGFERFTNDPLGLTPQALYCRGAPQAQIVAFKTRSQTGLLFMFVRVPLRSGNSAIKGYN
jgi:hypothetical protein